MDKKNKLYCIFKVYDYKGGELSSNINLTYDSFISSLTDLFEDIEVSTSEKRDITIDDVLGEQQLSIVDIIKKSIEEKIKNPSFLSLYAGGDGYCMTLYEISGNRLYKVSINDFIEDIALKINEY